MHLANERMRSLEMSGSDSVARVMATTSAFDCACVEDLWTLISRILGQSEFLSIYNIANRIDPFTVADTTCGEVKPDSDDRSAFISRSLVHFRFTLGVRLTSGMTIMCDILLCHFAVT